MKRFRTLTRRPRPASVFAATLAVLILGTLGTIGASDATMDDFRPQGDRTATVEAATGAEIDAAFQDGWTEGQDDLMATDCTEPVPTAPADTDPIAAAYNNGWIEGQQALIDGGACKPENLHLTPGDDNGDGIVDEDESGWDCATMGNRVCGPQSDAKHVSR
ncbi:hypothetical protein SEA_GILGAMESH_126 [Streptomyces phage Gilgamesh]|uniref:Uncharacterized protein n=1 Tax=Streptomyces phage Gilgamesh TaxID=2599890 RepID=A0A5J6TSG2_9CAUD|nr:hypothetical protein QEH35_gp126 [Streptomyces phage Gilgamesh]QFG13318.1 hypothetical protein SEA_GILGAMESH_126 [Streptomyces phage Gilgamesh]